MKTLKRALLYYIKNLCIRFAKTKCKSIIMPNKTNITPLAHFVVTYLLRNEIEVNHLKLQKLLYYIQGWHMVYFDGMLLFDEEPEAWVNGPVYRSVYNNYKHLGVYPKLTFKDGADTEKQYQTLLQALNLDDRQLEFLNSNLLHYGTMPHEKLVMMTHSEKPWNEAREGLSPFEYSDRKISLNTMRDYFSSLLKEK